GACHCGLSCQRYSGYCLAHETAQQAHKSRNSYDSEDNDVSHTHSGTCVKAGKDNKKAALPQLLRIFSGLTAEGSLHPPAPLCLFSAFPVRLVPVLCLLLGQR